MTGVLNAMAGQQAGIRYTVTIGAMSANVYGYNPSVPAGAISSNAFLGRTIVNVSSDGGVSQFAFTVALNFTGADLPTNFFQAVWVQGTDGIWKTYRTANASFQNNIWAWDAGGSRPWTGTSPASRALILVP
jgi:hypothetical protein